MGSGKNFNPDTDIGSLEGKVVLVTGANTGLGKQTVSYLAAHNPRIIYLAARTASKASAAIADLKREHPDANIVHLPLDLTSFDSIATAAKEFNSKETRLDLLINNAGVMAMPYTTTKEGFEIQLGTNHVGHALFTKLLLPTLLKTAEQQPNADVRIVNVTSLGHMMAPSEGVIFDQKKAESFSTWRRYGSSKLANILFSAELAHRYPQITSVSTHPGIIMTDLYDSARQNWFNKIGLWLYGWVFPLLPGHFKDARGGALTQTWAATAKKEELVNGGYYTPVGVKSQGSGKARDSGLAKKLWDWTEGELEKHGY